MSSKKEDHVCLFYRTLLISSCRRKGKEFFSDYSRAKYLDISYFACQLLTSRDKRITGRDLCALAEITYRCCDVISASGLRISKFLPFLSEHVRRLRLLLLMLPMTMQMFLQWSAWERDLQESHVLQPKLSRGSRQESQLCTT
ncbi:hypothetical protein OUZ56_019859 [Daphnia magna]|uniref:Uncharacterized protein n=1 Tax=Daphnia magna TaxID=35525 RepID=A0ABQ9ZCU2_9CRUS|nr:hypothetical protein OUZ56_019859 [Daphnia magna]